MEKNNTKSNYLIFDNNLARNYLNDKHKYHKALLNIGTSGVVAKAGITIP